MPSELNVANFQQTEKRSSALINLEYRPTDRFETTLSLMYMVDRLNNLNVSLYPIPAFNFAGISQLASNGNGLVTSGTQVGSPCFSTTTCSSTAQSFMDNDARKSFIRTRGADWRGTYKGDGWRVFGQLGISTSYNDISQAFKELFYGGGFNWNINRGFNYTNPVTANDPNYWADNDFGGNIGYKPYKARDSYGQFDFTKDFDGVLGGFLNNVQLGARWATHWESQSLLIYNEGVPNRTLPEIGFGGLTNLKGASDIGLTGSSVRHVQTQGFDSIFAAVLNGNTLIANDPVDYWDNTFNVKQENTAAYGQLNFGSDTVHGNLGVRWVQTKINSWGYNVPSTCSTWDCVFPPGFGYVGSSSTNDNWLPAGNIAWNVTPDIILRAAGSETIAYAPYNQYAPFFEANDTVLTATAGNPNLKPYRSVNGDLSAEWYFNPESVVAISGFYKNVLNYIVNEATIQGRQNGSWSQLIQGPTGQMLVNNGSCTLAGFCQYSVSAPVNGGRAKVKGAAISYQQAFGDSGFGLRANYTYSDSSTRNGGPLPYNSKNSYTLAPYFERGPYTASISYNYRSKYLAGGYVAGAPNAYTDSFKELDASAGYRFSDHFSLTFDMLNMLNSTYKQFYGSSMTQLANEYKSGREYLLQAHFKL